MTLASHIHDLVGDDAELRELRDGFEKYAYRGIAWHDFERRRAAAGRLARAPGLPQLIRPADFTVEAVEALSSPPRVSHLNDQRAALLAHRIRHRLVAILADTFGDLRAGVLVGTGILPATGARTCVPGGVWWSPPEAVALEMRTSGLLAGEATVFCGVEVRSPTPAARAPFSETIARRFLRRSPTSWVPERRPSPWPKPRRRCGSTSPAHRWRVSTRRSVC